VSNFHGHKVSCHFPLLRETGKKESIKHKAAKGKK